MRRTFSVLVAVLGAAFLLSACGSGPGAPAAAKVNTDRILRSELTDQLEVLSHNTKWLKSIASDFGATTLTDPNGNVSTKFAAAWLTAMMNQSIVDQRFEQKHLKVTDANKATAKTAAEGLFNTDKGQTFDTMPKWFRDDFLAGQARYEAVRATVPDNPPATPAQLQSLFERTKGQYCPSGNAVSHILANSREAAEQVEAALASGQDFATLAKQSQDEGTRNAGGFLTCTGAANYSQLPEAFRTAVSQVPVGTVSQPIQSDAGWHVVKVTPYDLTNLRAFYDYLYDTSLKPPMTQFINNQLLKAKLWVDPRYGTLAKGPVQVRPPSAPNVRTEPPTTATTTPGS